MGGPVGWAKPKLAHRAVGRGGVAQKCAFQCGALCAQCVLDGQALSSERAEQVVKSTSDLFGGVLAEASSSRASASSQRCCRPP